MTSTMELIDLVPNSLSFRVIATADITDEAEIPEGFTGRVRFHRNDRVEYVAWYVDGLLQNPGRRDLGMSATLLFPNREIVERYYVPLIYTACRTCYSELDPDEIFRRADTIDVSLGARR